jgi:hypothetical protein
MVVTLNKPLNDYGYNWPAGQQAEVSVKFYRILVASGHVDPHPEDATYQKPKATKAKPAPAPAPEVPTDNPE